MKQDAYLVLFEDFQFTLGNVDYTVTRAAPSVGPPPQLHCVHFIVYLLHRVSTPSCDHSIVCPLRCVYTITYIHSIVNALHLVYPASLLSLLFLFTRPLTWLGTPFLVSSVDALAFSLAFFSPWTIPPPIFCFAVAGLAVP